MISLMLAKLTLSIFCSLGQIEEEFFFFPLSALTPSVKPLGLISTFAPIGMLDFLGSTIGPDS